MRAKPPEQPSHHHPNNLPPTHPRRILISHHHLHLHLHLHSPSPPSTSHIHFTPTLIAMLVVAATAFLLVNYYRFLSRHLFPPFRRITRCYKRWRQRRLFLSSSHSDTYSLPAPYDISSDGFYIYSPYGLADSVINNIPLQIYKPPTRPRGSISSSSKLDFYDDDCLHDDFHDCAVCLLDFEDGDYMRTLPLCCHSFHADCIDMWLRAHATCPLCRAGAYESPLAPLMAARIRPSLDEGIMLESSFLAPLVEQSSGEIQEERNESLRELFFPDTRRIQSDNHRFSVNGVLKRSHSFSFETDRIGVGVRGATTTPHSRQKGLWMKRACSSTPYRSIAKSRVFLSLRITKSPVGRRRGGYFGMSSETWSRRMIKSSRMRMGDPEALISPERY